MAKKDPLQQLMDEFYADTSYDEEGDWRKVPELAEEPDEKAGGKKDA